MREDGKGGFFVAVETDLADQDFIAKQATVELGCRRTGTGGAVWGRVAERIPHTPRHTLFRPWSVDTV